MIKKTSTQLCTAMLALAMMVLATFPTHAQSSHKSFDFFVGVDFGASDMNFVRQYDLLLGVKPGFKWNMGSYWELAGMTNITLLNQIAPEYSGFYNTMLVVSKQMKLGGLYGKVSAGLFDSERYGVDVKAFLPVADWFAFEAQAGLTGLCTFHGGLYFNEWMMSNMERFSGTIGGDIYLTRWNTQLRGTIGRYVYKDYGFECEAMRHFKHSTITLFGHWSNLGKTEAGFKIIAMIPPYHRKQHKVNIRPISNFRIQYYINGSQYSNKIYRTDPEENERDGWFSRDLLNWGSHTMEPDFTTNNKEENQ